MGGRQQTGKPVEAAAAAWLASMASSLDETTRKQYAIYARAHWQPFFGTLREITEATGEAYWRRRLERVRRRTVTKELSALRGFLAWCAKSGRIVCAPTITTPPRRAHGTRDTSRARKGAPVDLELHEVRALLDALPERSPGGPRGPAFVVRARFVVAWETALRPATLAGLVAPFDYARGRETLRIRDEIDKARFGREVPLTSRARAALDSVCPRNGLIFGEHDCRPYLRAAARASLVPSKADALSPYDLRHARLTFLAERTKNLLGLAWLAGHRHLSTTSRYTHASLRAARAVLSSRGVA